MTKNRSIYDVGAHKNGIVELLSERAQDKKGKKP